MMQFIRSVFLYIQRQMQKVRAAWSARGPTPARCFDRDAPPQSRQPTRVPAFRTCLNKSVACLPPHRPLPFALQNGQNTGTVRFLMCCIQCCLKCIQTAIEVITRNAYVYVALKGVSFCAVSLPFYSF
jgi:hypothetical protein